MKFKILGMFTVNKKTQIFNLNVEAKNEKLAKEKVFSLIGSWYKCKRNFVNIKEIKEVKNG